MPQHNPRNSAPRAEAVESRLLSSLLASAALLALFFLSAGLVPVTSHAAAARSASRTLTLEERVAYQRAVEDVYWRRTVWPAENNRPKPSLDEVLPLEATRAKVEETLRKSDALARQWGRPVTAEQLQAEVTRMARETRQPEVLRELWRALGDDPFVIAEVLARPALVDRQARTLYYADERFHGGLRERVETELRQNPSLAALRAAGGSFSKADFVRTGRKAPSASEVAGAQELPADEWAAERDRLAEGFGAAASGALPLGEVSGLQEAGESFYVESVVADAANGLTVARISWPKVGFDAWWSGASADYSAGAPTSNFDYRLPEISAAAADDTWTPTSWLPVATGTAVWTGTEVIVWGGTTSSGGRTNTGSRYNPATDTWTATSTTGAPEERLNHSAVWTGTEMIVWGGSNGVGRVNTGGRYNPATDIWRPTANGNVFRDRHTAVWTGSKMVIWGGCTLSGSDGCRIGGVYDPAADTWKPTSLVNAPTNRVGHRAVWAGSEMIVWGGSDNSGPKNTGGRYNPETDTWTPTNTFNAPSARSAFTMVWTGTEAVVWSGYEGNFVTVSSGGRYNPATDTWTPTSTAGAPDPRYFHTAVWSGSEMIVYGGRLAPVADQPDVYLNSGGRYDPSTDSWKPTSTVNAPTKLNHVAVWTGSEMVVWGGSATSLVFRSGARYNPASDTWAAAGTVEQVPATELGVWSGAEMLVWGKAPLCSSGCESVGGRYNPATNVWRPMSLAGAPAGDNAAGAAAVWTGKEMFVWGAGTAAGARYNPLADAWGHASTAGAPEGKAYASAVWTGGEVLVWGGGNNNPDNIPSAGGRYNPTSDTWKLMSMADAPAPRYLHSAVWTGSEMVVWGGTQYFAGSHLNTGGRYNPATDTWRPTSTAGAPEARIYNSAVWTGDELIVWGGWVYSNEGSRFLDTGGRYNPSSDVWSPTSTAGAPQARSHHRAVWTGSQMIVWGGLVPVTFTSNGDDTNTGARYNPASDVWTPTSLQSAPSRRNSHVQVWTGKQMIVWGGKTSRGDGFGDGALYNAAGAEPGNGLPLVRLTAPAAGASYQSGNTVRLTAEASDADGSVTAVRFYANGSLIGSTTQAPYVFDWVEVRGGGYALSAVAVDSAGGEGASASVNITVTPSTVPPACSLTSPADGASYAYGSSVRMEAAAGANRDRAIATVEFLDNGTVVSSYSAPTYTAPWVYTYLSPASGSHTLTARCTDSAGAATVSAAKVVNVEPSAYSVSGQVLDDRGSAVEGVRLRLDGPAGTAPQYVTTAVRFNASYSFSGLKPGATYTVTPEPGAWRFTPESLTFTSIAGDKSGQNFTATRAGYGVSGYLRDAGGNPIFPATVNLSGSKTASTATDVNGYYFFANLAPGGTYTVQPYRNLYSFAPNFRTFENLGAEQTADFTGAPQAATYAVAGRVLDDKGAPLAGLRVRLDTVRVVGTQYRTTDADGRYSFGAVEAGETCQVFPEDFTYAYGFSPTSPRLYVGLAGNVSDADFVATPRTVSGRITSSGAGVEGVTVTLSGPQSATATTGPDGAFVFGGVTLRGDYTVTASKPGLALTPAAHTLKDFKEDVTAADFAVMPRFEDSADFVTQHYRDFLNREPDASGLNFWVGEVESCGADAVCREVKRINVSAAFFLSIEFQETGYLAYRVHKAAFGNLPGKPVPVTRQEMLDDVRIVASGLIVGAQGWEQKLEQNKQAYFDQFVASERFKTLYPQSMTPEAYVDALNVNADGALSQAERDVLVTSLKNGAKTRAQVLRSVAENPELNKAEKNRAFVLMQFFGYLRRNPDGAPDKDFSGFNFWLGKLDEFNGNFIQAEMVKAFLESIEYRNRFGQ